MSRLTRFLDGLFTESEWYGIVALQNRRLKHNNLKQYSLGIIVCLDLIFELTRYIFIFKVLKILNISMTLYSK